MTKNMSILLGTVLSMGALGIMAIICISIFRPMVDNALIVIAMLGFLAPLIIGSAGIMLRINELEVKISALSPQVERVHTSMNAGVAELIAETKRASDAAIAAATQAAERVSQVAVQLQDTKKQERQPPGPGKGG